MKKIISILLVVMMMTALLIPCASAEESFEGKTVVIVTGNFRGNTDLYECVAAAKIEYESKGADVILLDAGNYLQGEAYANESRGLAVYDLMEAVGYDAAAMGAYEFSYGDATTGMIYHSNFHKYYTQAELYAGCDALTYKVNGAGTVTADRAAKASAGFIVISSNIEIGEDASGYYLFDKAASIQKNDGLNVGVVAVTDENTPAMLQDGFMKGYSFCEVEAPECDFLVCLNNSGEEVQGADITVNAPTDGTAVVKAYVVDNATKAVEDLAINPNGKCEVAENAVKAAVEGFDAGKLVGECYVTLTGADSVGWKQETNLGDLVTDALKWYAENKFEGFKKDVPVVAIQNGGNCDQFLYSGAVTETDLLRALPFSPMGVGIIYVSGAQLLEILEAGTCPSESYGELCPGFAQVAGLEYTVNAFKDYDAGAEYGKFYEANSVNRVTITSVNGQAFDENASYAVIADNFLMNGNDTYYVLKEAKAAEGAQYINNGNGVKTRDIVAMYIKEALGGKIGEDYAQAQGRITVCSSPFTDVAENAWYFDSVKYVLQNGLMNGVTATTFEPDTKMTRAMFVTVLYRMEGSPDVSGKTEPFTDVPDDYWCRDAIIWAYNEGITTGVTATSFAPKTSISRGQLVTMLYRYEGSPEVSGDIGVFTDAGTIAAPFVNAVIWANANAIVQGYNDGSFRPTRTADRATMAVIIARYDAA